MDKKTFLFPAVFFLLFASRFLHGVPAGANPKERPSDARFSFFAVICLGMET